MTFNFRINVRIKPFFYYASIKKLLKITLQNDYWLEFMAVFGIKNTKIDCDNGHLNISKCT